MRTELPGRAGALRKLAFTPETFLLSYPLPDFYFHVVTACNILRARGGGRGKYHTRQRHMHSHAIEQTVCRWQAFSAPTASGRRDAFYRSTGHDRGQRLSPTSASGILPLCREPEKADICCRIASSRSLRRVHVRCSSSGGRISFLRLRGRGRRSANSQSILGYGSI
ncbi:DUF1993 family protein [Hyphomicrobium sp. DY-1]|uniref:DUF1993 family protein n=1 Tax=Hyphomicrobium sp. DY-1 TaxID=3075650 RepID=UPI0039C1A3C0